MDIGCRLDLGQIVLLGYGLPTFASHAVCSTVAELLVFIDAIIWIQGVP